jgi:hypothetical protein
MELEVHEDANADELLTAFFTLEAEGLRGRRAERMAAAERSFRRCLEGRIEHILTPAERTILEAERQFQPIGAGARLAAPSVILKVLPTFLETWDGAELEERRVQIVAAERLLAVVSTFPPVERDLAPHVMAARIAVRRSRRRYDLARLEDRHAARSRSDGDSRR